MNKPTIIENHEWVSLVLGKRRLTVSYSGSKSTGGIPDEVFDLWDKVTHHQPDALAKIGLNALTRPPLMEIIRTFADKIDTIWPDWNKEPEMPVVGSTIRVNFGKRKGIEEGVVTEVKKSYIFAKFPTQGHIGVHFGMLVRV